MLEDADLKARMAKDEYKPERETLSHRLGALQREARAAGLPVLLVVDGWQASGLGTVIGRLLSALDPRGYKLHVSGPPTVEQKLYPPMWRYWLTLPPHGGIAVYDGGWYGDVLRAKKKERPSAVERICIFERQQADDGAVLIKIWLHISKKEQARRFRKLEKTKALSWRISRQDWRNHDRFDARCRVVDDMLAETSTDYAPWTVIPAENLRYATVEAAKTVIRTLEQAIEPGRKPPAKPFTPTSERPLDKVDLTRSMTRETYDAQLDKLQDKLRRAQHRLYLPRVPVVIVYEGWDASGKGGNIKRLVADLDHRGFEVIPIGPPEGEEKTRHYLWRFWKSLPKAGHITIFDRSWYGRVLVERIEGYATTAQWQRAYREINEFEKQLTGYGAILIKFWIHISKDEQLKRFKSRQNTPYKKWKINEEDWRNRKKWDAYYNAVSDMIELTSTPDAPWTIVEGNCKLYARIKVLETVLFALKQDRSQ